MNGRSLATLLIALLLVTPAVADEDSVYESLGQIPIGRIFLTPDERARLDKVRGRNGVRRSVVQRTGAAPVSSKDAAGFIVSDSGATRVWRNGEFVATASASHVRFPGQVKVASQQAQSDEKQARETDKPVVEAGDEQE